MYPKHTGYPNPSINNLLLQEREEARQEEERRVQKRRRWSGTKWSTSSESGRSVVFRGELSGSWLEMRGLTGKTVAVAWHFFNLGLLVGNWVARLKDILEINNLSYTVGVLCNCIAIK